MTEPYVIKTLTDQSSHVSFTCELRENESCYSLDQFTCEFSIHMCSSHVNWEFTHVNQFS